MALGGAPLDVHDFLPTKFQRFRHPYIPGEVRWILPTIAICPGRTVNFPGCTYLVGGFKPSEKYSSNWIISPIFGVKIKNISNHHLPWEPKTFIFRGYNPYIGGLKPSFFMVLGSKGRYCYTFSPHPNITCRGMRTGDVGRVGTEPLRLERPLGGGVAAMSSSKPWRSKSERKGESLASASWYNIYIYCIL